MGIIERMILFDLLKFTAMSLVASSGLLMVVGAMLEASQRGIDPLQVLAFMPYLMAPTLPYTLPSCLLFSCTVVFGGMAGSNEITALKAGGIHVARILWPAILLGVSLCALGVQLADRVIPACNRQFTDAILSDLQGTMYAYLREKGSIVQSDFPYELYVRNVQEDKLLNVVIKHRSPKGGYDMVAKAAEATLRVIVPPAGLAPAGGKPSVTTSSGATADPLDEGVRLEIRLQDVIASTAVDNNVHLHDKTEVMPFPAIVNRGDQKIETLSFAMLRVRSNERRSKARVLDEELAWQAGMTFVTGDTKRLTTIFEQNRVDAKMFEQKSRDALAEIQLRMAQSMAAVPFVLLGAPLAMLFKQREFLRTFFVCFLPIITLYYPAMILAFNVAKESPRPEAGGLLWIPSIALCAVSAPFLRRTFRH